MNGSCAYHGHPTGTKAPIPGENPNEYSDSETTRTVLHHDLEELDSHLGSGAEQHLALAALLGVDHGVQGVVQH